MGIYQITKYDPKNRDATGKYCIEEWTSISDIDKIYNAKVFDIKTYIATENAYIEVVTKLMECYSIESLYVKELEKYLDVEDIYKIIQKYPEYYSDRILEVFKSVVEDSKLDIKDTQLMCSLILREHLWSELCSKEKDFVVKFGYDYYMTIECPEIQKEIVKIINENGLFLL